MWDKQKAQLHRIRSTSSSKHVGHGKARMRMPFREAGHQRRGRVHGGAIVSLCDTCFYVALATLYGPMQPTATASLTCNFLRPARPPHDLIAHADVLKAGSRDRLRRGHVYSGEKLVAHATLNFINTPIEEYRRSATEDAQVGHVRL